MTRDEIITMARQAGFDLHDMSADFTCNLDNIEALVKLVAEHEPVGKFAKFTDGIWREVADGSAGVPLYAKLKEKNNG